ncbi:hypothetical protein F5Y10DRAFT_238623, partial [Nemania abortiva]
MKTVPDSCCRVALGGVEEPSDDDLDQLGKIPPEGSYKFGSVLINRFSSGDSDLRIQALHSVESTLDTLHLFSLAIRKASSRNSLIKLPNLPDADDGFQLAWQLEESGTVSKEIAVQPVRFDITLVFENFVRRLLVKRWLIPDTNKDLLQEQEDYREIMLDRCVKSISARRRQLTYFRDHQTKLETQATTNVGTGAPQPVRPAVQSPTTPLPFSQSNFQHTHTQQHAIGGRAEEALSETLGSELQPGVLNFMPSAYAPSSVTSSAAASLSSRGPVEVPPAPELEPQEKEKMCPYCYLVYPAKIFSTKKRSRTWRKHLLEDLQPYICLFKNCPQPGKTYRNFREWQSHLSQVHAEYWLCPLPHPGVNHSTEQPGLCFALSSQFHDHLDLAHSDLDLSTAQSVYQEARRPAALPQWCFVCLKSQSSVTSLERHLEGHLYQAFLIALPGRDDIKEADFASDRLSNGTTPLNIDDDV